MKILKYLLFLLLIAFIAGSIYIATKDSDYRFEKTRIIEAPAPLLFKEVSEFENWQSWAWIGEDEADISISEDTLDGGASISWQGAKVGDGTLTNVNMDSFNRIDQRLVFDAGITDSDSEVYWIFEPLEEGTRVTWGMQGDQSFKEKLAFTLRGKNISDIFSSYLESGLQELDTQILGKMEEFSIKVNGVTRHGGGYYMYTTTATKISEIHERGATMIQQVTSYMQENDISINGNPFILYNQRDEENNTAIFSAAVPTPSQVVTPSGSAVLNGFLPSQRVVKTTLKGNHKNATLAWENTYDFIEKNELEIDKNGESFEIYITNPAEEENPALWVTEIYIPIH